MASNKHQIGKYECAANFAMFWFAKHMYILFVKYSFVSCKLHVDTRMTVLYLICKLYFFGTLGIIVVCTISIVQFKLFSFREYFYVTGLVPKANLQVSGRCGADCSPKVSGRG